MGALLWNADKVEIADYKHACITALCFVTYAVKLTIELYTANTQNSICEEEKKSNRKILFQLWRLGEHPEKQLFS